MEIIREDVFRKQMKKGLSGGYLFFGEEDYLKAFALKSARESICADEAFAIFNDVRLDALDFTASTLLDALMPPPMMGEQKIVSVSGLSISSMKQSELEELCDTLSALRDYDYNVLILSIPDGEIDEGSLPKRPSATLTRLSEYLTPVRFESISGARLAAWVGKHFEHHGVTAEPALCQYLIDRCGKSMYHLANETEKLSYYVLEKERTAIRRDDIDLVAVPEVSSDAFALANAILDGDHVAAIDALSVMRFRRVEPVIILGEVSRVICDMISIKALQLEGQPIGEISRILKIKNEYKTKLYASKTSGKTMDRLTRAVELCSEADLALKLSPQGYLAIEKLIACL